MVLRPRSGCQPREGEDRPISMEHYYGTPKRADKVLKSAESPERMAGQGIHGRVPCDDPRVLDLVVFLGLGAEPRCKPRDAVLPVSDRRCTRSRRMN